MTSKPPPLPSAVARCWSCNSLDIFRSSRCEFCYRKGLGPVAVDDDQSFWDKAVIALVGRGVSTAVSFEVADKLLEERSKRFKKVGGK